MENMLIGFGVGVLMMIFVCTAMLTSIEKKYAKKLKNLEEKAELKAYRKIMDNLSIRKEL